EFVLPVLHDPSVQMGSAELRGAPYVLNVWGSWCVACREEHPVLTRFAETRRVRVVGYNWKDEPEDALRWLEQFGNPFFVVLADYEGRYVLDWGVAGAPETFLVDGAGVVRWKHTGPLTEQVVAERLLPALDPAERGRCGPWPPARRACCWPRRWPWRKRRPPSPRPPATRHHRASATPPRKPASTP